jgi:shikimate 5-dehydrogenase
LREDLAVKLEGAKVLLLGTGGAGQVAALRLALENVSELFLVEFVSAKAEAVAQEIRKRYREGESGGRVFRRGRWICC